jgi:hypothetical protein
MERIYRTSTRRLELNHKLNVATLTQREREAALSEIASIKVSAEVDEARWKNTVADWERKQTHRVDIAETESEMLIKVQLDAIEMAKLRVEEQRILRQTEDEGLEADAARGQAARLAEIQAEREALALRMEQQRAEVELEQVKARAELGLEQERVQFKDKMTEAEFDREQRLLDAEARRRAEDFDTVQKATRERQVDESRKEESRLETHKGMSDKVLGVLGDIAGGDTTSDEVKLEALKQLGDLRKTDVSGSKEAYIDESDGTKKKLSKKSSSVVIQDSMAEIQIDGNVGEVVIGKGSSVTIQLGSKDGLRKADELFHDYRRKLRSLRTDPDKQATKKIDSMVVDLNTMAQSFLELGSTSLAAQFMALMARGQFLRGNVDQMKKSLDMALSLDQYCDFALLHLGEFHSQIARRLRMWGKTDAAREELVAATHYLRTGMKHAGDNTARNNAGFQLCEALIALNEDDEAQEVKQWLEGRVTNKKGRKKIENLQI